MIKNNTSRQEAHANLILVEYVYSRVDRHARLAIDDDLGD